MFSGVAAVVSYKRTEYNGWQIITIHRFLRFIGRRTTNNQHGDGFDWFGGGTAADGYGCVTIRIGDSGVIPAIAETLAASTSASLTVSVDLVVSY